MLRRTATLCSAGRCRFGREYLRKILHPLYKPLPTLFKIIKFVETGSSGRQQDDIPWFDNRGGGLTAGLKVRKPH